jgi:uncharacterized metal-binding protein
MPGHRVHDLLTVGAAAMAIPAYWALADRPEAAEALLLAGACLISGILFSPDLDLPSRPRRRWGPAAVLWWPYEALVPHRSWVSHSAVLGPVLRLGYFAVVSYLLCWGGLWAVNRWVAPVDRNGLVRGWRQDAAAAATRYPRAAGLMLGGFVLGGVTHTTADVVWSRLRRRRRRR